MVKLATGVMPPSNVGRKPKPLNEEMVEALFEHLNSGAPEEMEDENGDTKLYPVFVGPDFSDKTHVFAKDFQASADGRKYAKVLHKRVGKVVRVNVYHNGVVDSAGKPTEGTRYSWRLYVPISEYSDDEITAFAEAALAAEEAAEEGAGEEAPPEETPEETPSEEKKAKK